MFEALIYPPKSHASDSHDRRRDQVQNGRELNNWNAMRKKPQKTSKSDLSVAAQRYRDL
jgi:hypothetical protein